MLEAEEVIGLSELGESVAERNPESEAEAESGEGGQEAEMGKACEDGSGLSSPAAATSYPPSLYPRTRRGITNGGGEVGCMQVWSQIAWKKHRGGRELDVCEEAGPFSLSN